MLRRTGRCSRAPSVLEKKMEIIADLLNNLGNICNLLSQGTGINKASVVYWLMFAVDPEIQEGNRKLLPLR